MSQGFMLFIIAIITVFYIKTELDIAFKILLPHKYDIQ